jgi:transcriptional regulator with XRE-family HTH domain
MTPTHLSAALSTLGWRGAELARRLGCHKCTVSDWQTGEQKIPAVVAAWLEQRVAAEAAMPAPPSWRTRSGART